MVRLELHLPTAVLSCQAILFDLDGVLVDSTALIDGQLREWAREHGVDAQRIIKMSPGRTNADLVAEFAPHLDAFAEQQLMLDREVASAPGLMACDGALAMVAQLPARSWAVVTSGNRPVAEARLNAAGVPLPEVLVSADDVDAGKPDPQGYQLAARRLGVAAEQCVVIEDAAAGLEAAARAGMRAVAVTASGARLTAPYDHAVHSLAAVSVHVSD